MNTNHAPRRNSDHGSSRGEARPHGGSGRSHDARPAAPASRGGHHGAPRRLDNRAGYSAPGAARAALTGEPAPHRTAHAAPRSAPHGDRSVRASGHSNSRGGFGQRPRFGGPSSSNRGGYGGRPSSGGGRRNFRDQRIDVSRFVNRAIITEEAPVYVPEHNFNDFKIDDRIKANIARKGYITPSPIQDKAIPHVHRGEDVVGIANTGTGKTAAFLLPLIDRVLTQNERVIILAPTRELAVQIETELRDFVPGLRIGSACCVGGAPMGRQISDLRRTPAFVVGTPGRLKDLMQQRHLDLSGFNAMVLDEADRMLDMGFIADVRFMMSQMPKERQTLLFTATMSREIENLIGDFLNQPVRISVKTGETSKNVDQDVVRVERGQNKIEKLADLLADKADFSKVLIFGRTKHGVQRLSGDLNALGFKTDAIHGNKSHSQRMRALDAFKSGRIQAMIATDVAARGLDVSGVTHVINYELPATYDDYVHRIGRTGRGDKKGKAITFVD